MRNAMLPVCETCAAWDQRYPDNKGLGVCSRMGAIAVEGQYVSILVREADDLSPPTSDFPAVNTQRYFGCREHSQRRTLE